MVNPRRLVTRAQRRINVLAGLALASLVLAWLAGFGSAPIKNTSAAAIENTRATAIENASAAAIKNTGAAPIDNTRAAAIENASAAAIENASAAAIENTSAASIAERHEPTLIASAELTQIPRLVAAGNAGIVTADVVTATESVTANATEPTADPVEPKSMVLAALPDSSQILPPDLPSEQAATAATRDNVQPAVSSIGILDEECLVAEICIDRYLWALYERAPKLDSIKVEERRKVTVKRKGKTITVTKTFTKRVDDDFTWKDPKAAERARMTMMDYVIGGMDRSFKLKLFHTLHAAEQAGLSPGITSAFRDDYRQSIASGLKAAADRSYHGGSFRGGYGRGLAADVVSVNGGTRAQRWVSTEKFWKWIDENGKQFGIGRPYLDRDPPHVAPINGQEYASRRGGAKSQHAEAKIKKNAETKVRKNAEAKIKKGKRLAVRNDHTVAKRAKTASAKTARL